MKHNQLQDCTIVLYLEQELTGKESAKNKQHYLIFQHQKCVRYFSILQRVPVLRRKANNLFC